MENSCIEEFVTISSDNAAFEIKIKDFHSATKPLFINVKFDHTDKSFKYTFWTEIIPNYVENRECWLAFIPISVNRGDLINKLPSQYLGGTLSIIDVEGKSRFPRFDQYFGDNISSGPPDELLKYLTKSSILESKEELLPDGVLTLRVNFIFESRRIDGLNEVDFDYHAEIYKCEHFLNSTRQSKDTTEPQKEKFTEMTVYDYTRKIFKLPQFHEARMRFGVHGIPPEKTSVSSELEEVNPEIFEYVWAVDFQDEHKMILHRFLLSLDELEDSVGTRLLRASPVFRRMVNSPMREQKEKRIKFQKGYMTFRHVLDFLSTGRLETYYLTFPYILVDLYKFSHMYQMEKLQRKCAKRLVENSKHESEFEELEGIAELHQDEYLSELLKIRRDVNENLKKALFRTNDDGLNESVSDSDDEQYWSRDDYLLSETPINRIKNKYTTEPQRDIITEDSSYELRVYDLTCKILILPQFHEARRRFGVYGIPSEEPLFSSEIEEVNPDSFEHVWIFDIKDENQIDLERFLVSLDEREDSVGTRFLRASPVLRKMVNAPMREQQEKRIEFVNISCDLTFYYTLIFLAHRNLMTDDFDELVDIYKFSHLYEMEELQRKCGESMVKSSEYKIQLEKLESIAEHYEDKNLSELLKLLREDYGTLKQSFFRTDDIPNSDCYI